MKKKLMSLIFILVLFLFKSNNVNALEEDFLITLDYTNKLNQTKLEFKDYLPNSADNKHFAYFKISTNNDIAYCSDGDRSSPGLTEGIVNWRRECRVLTPEEHSRELMYIYEKAYGKYSSGSYSTNDYLTGDYKKDYFISQLVVWKYTGAPSWYNNFNFTTGVYLDGSNEITQKASKLYTDASKTATQGATLNVTTSNSTMTLTSDNKYYISDTIKLSGTQLNSKITVSTTGVSGAFVTTNKDGTTGTTTFDNNSIVYIKIPKANISTSSSLTLTAKATSYLGGEIIDCEYYDPDANIQSIIVYDPGNDQLSKNLNITVDVAKYPVKISKKNITGSEEVAGAKLVIKKGNSTIDSWTSGTIPVTKNLEPGTYILEETIAPAGYIKNTSKIEFTVNNEGKVLVNNKEVSEVIMTNEPIMVTISKKDVAGSEEIPGAELKITTEDGETAKDIDGNPLEWTSTNEPKEFHLAAGTYILSETVAPEGYAKSESKIQFVVDEEGKVTVGGKEVEEVVITNKLITITISKRSITGSEEIPGAKLKITDKKGNIVKDSEGNLLEWTSIATARSFHLAAGTYILTETVAPEGYELSETSIEFTVTAEGKVLIDGKEVDNNLIIFTNTPEPEQVLTGNSGMYIVVAVAIVAVSSAIGTYIIIKKRRK